MGCWYYTPPRRDAALATLHDGYRSIDLRYSAEPVQDLLLRLARLETSYAAAAGVQHEQGTSAYDGPWQHRRA
ncbi:hypothetical protein [Streptomyces sp. NPDC016845]|uniref:hypothetical protein n=1 Tax=Streptomyces sp. NPDC016845 TaxID=3364972 RepID=UPI00378E9E5D